MSPFFFVVTILRNITDILFFQDYILFLDYEYDIMKKIYCMICDSRADTNCRMTI